MGKLSQALQGLGAGLQQVGQMGLQSTMDETRQKRLAEVKGELSAEASGVDRTFRAEESAKERASREKIAGIGRSAAASKPTYRTEEDREGNKITWMRVPGQPDKKFDVTTEQWVPAGTPRPLSQEEAAPLASELVNDFTTTLGWDSTDLGMPEEDQINIVTQDLMSGLSEPEIRANISAARSRGQPYRGVSASGRAPGGVDQPAPDVRSKMLSLMSGGATPEGAPVAAPGGAPGVTPLAPPGGAQPATPAPQTSRKVARLLNRRMSLSEQINVREVPEEGRTLVVQAKRLIKDFDRSLIRANSVAVTPEGAAALQEALPYLSGEDRAKAEEALRWNQKLQASQAARTGM